MSGSVVPGGSRVLGGVLGLPDPVYWIPVALLFVGVLAILYLIGPTVTDWTVPAFGTWVVAGALLHVLRRQSIFPDLLEPLFGAPMVYLTTATMTVIAWSLSELVVEMRSARASCDRQVAVGGTAVVVVVVAVSLVDAIGTGVVRPLWPTLALFGAAILTAVVWVAMSIFATDTAKTTGKTGVVLLFAHLLDAITTGIGVVGPDPLPRLIGQDGLSPIAGFVFESAGEGSLVAGALAFVAVKLLLAVAVVVAFERVVEQRPPAARLGLGAVVAAGLGPALHNVLLFTVFASVLPV
jgi:uncharacterized membrane protein